MMNMERRFDTYYDRAINTSVLHLPFDSSYSMLLLLPDDMSTLENAISPLYVTKWLKWMTARSGESKIFLKLLVSTLEGLTRCNQLSFVLSAQLLQNNFNKSISHFFLGHITYIFQSSPSRLPTTWMMCCLKWEWQTCLVTVQIWVAFPMGPNWPSPM